jgi:hypothetical protein
MHACLIREAQGALVYASYKVPRRPCSTPNEFIKIITVRRIGCFGGFGVGVGCSSGVLPYPTQTTIRMINPNRL